jgi:serine-type D-Ala-D-Ala carboxypeptidase/endopeptidase
MAIQRMYGLMCAIGVMLGCAAVSLRAAETESTLAEQITRLAQPYLDNEIVVGMTIGAVHEGEQVVLGFGKCGVTNATIPDGDTVYEIGSITKVFTGLLLADAVVREQVKLEQPVNELLPEGVTMPERDGKSITLVQLSTHTSGLPRLPGNFKIVDPENPYADYTPEMLHEFLGGHKPQRAPGEKSEYSNLGAGLLGHLLARKAESSYEDLLCERITKPLGMSSTLIDLSEDAKAHLAIAHTADCIATHNWEMGALHGAGAIRGTVNDMLRFARANLDPPDSDLGKAIDMAWQIQQEPLEESNFAMGLGWHIARDGSMRWHNGQTGGYHSMLLVNRDLNAAVVVLANTATGQVDPLAEGIMQTIAGQKAKTPKFDKLVDVPREVMQRYVGEYALMPFVKFTVTLRDDKLMVGLTGQDEYRIYPKSETEWKYRVVEAEISFKVDDDGKCTALELFQNGARREAKRIE